jgi:hypothetical protein
MNIMAIRRPERLVQDWRELEDADVPLEPLEFRVGIKPNAGLTIRQMPTDYNEAVIREIEGRVAYVMPVFIRRDEPGRTIIRSCTLHVPWDDSVEWLDEDKKRNRGWYTFSREYPPKHEYARDTVLNHRMKGILSLGDIREGLLLAVGKVRPPEMYRDGEIIPIRFSILDQWDCEPSVTFQLPLVRGRHRGNEIPKSKRGPLFSRPDYIDPVNKRKAPPAESAKEEKQSHIEK